MKTRSLFSITEIIIHCSATDEARRTTVEEIDRWHRERGFDCIGYHYYITRNGGLHVGRELNEVGAHCKGHNQQSVGICLEGGLRDGKPCDTRTPEQKVVLRALCFALATALPTITQIHGHNEFAAKACPCFDVQQDKELQSAIWMSVENIVKK